MKWGSGGLDGLTRQLGAGRRSARSPWVEAGRRVEELQRQAREICAEPEAVPPVQGPRRPLSEEEYAARLEKLRRQAAAIGDDGGEA